MGTAARTGSFDALGHVFASALRRRRTLAQLVGRGIRRARGQRRDRPAGTASAQPERTTSSSRWLGETGRARGTDRPGVLAWLQWDINRRAVGSRRRGSRAARGLRRVGRWPARSSSAAQPGLWEEHTRRARSSPPASSTSPTKQCRSTCTPGQVRAFPRPMALDERSLDLLPEIAPLRVSQLGRHAQACGGTEAGRPPPSSDTPLDVVMVLFPERDPSGTHRAGAHQQPATQSSGSPRTRSTSRVTDVTRSDALALLVQGAEAYLIVGDDPRTAASAVDRRARADASHASRAAMEERVMSRRHVAAPT